MSLIEQAQRTRLAAQGLATQTAAVKNQALEAIAQSLEASSPEIIAANAKDCELAQASGLTSALYGRLKLDGGKLESAIAGVRSVATLTDPVGEVQIHRELDQGLILKRISCPLGVLGIIFEARPDAVMQISALAIKSGNGVLLKGGQEALNTCQALVKAIQAGLAQTPIDPAVVALLTSREETMELLKLDRHVDLIIPRGSNRFVQFVQDNTRIPVLGHAEGICHLYIDRAADLAKAIPIVVDSKTQYPAACNAIETLLVHQDVAATVLPEVTQALIAKGVLLRGDASTQAIAAVEPATEEDWATEYSDLVLAIGWWRIWKGRSPISTLTARVTPRRS
jgi:glutamate-5-semialdehyde dehydrogenase